MIAIWLRFIHLCLLIREEFLHLEYIRSVRRTIHSIRVIVTDPSSPCVTSLVVAFFGCKTFLTQCISRPSFFPPFHFLLFFLSDLYISTATYPLSDDLINRSRSFGLLLICNLHKWMQLFLGLLFLGHLRQSKIHEEREICLAFDLLIDLAW